MKVDKATNIYESMLIKVYNDYLKEVSEKTDDIEANIIERLKESSIDNFHAMERALMVYMDILECLYSDDVYISLFSYKKNDEKEKFKKYADFNLSLMNQELEALEMMGVDSPYATEALYPIPNDRINEMFNECVYEKMKYNIAFGYKILEFKITNDEYEHVLLMSGDFVYH